MTYVPAALRRLAYERAGGACEYGLAPEATAPGGLSHAGASGTLGYGRREMPTVHIEANLSTGELLKAVDALEPAELDQFVAEVLALRARRRAPSLPSDEAELLLRINRGLPDDLRARYDELRAKQDAETLEPEDHEELLRIVTRMEDLQAERAEDLARLAQLRGITLSSLLESLGIQAPRHA